MRYLKLYENFEDIKEICSQYNIWDYIINQDGTVDVDNYVAMGNYGLTKLPLNFGRVSGTFDIAGNKLKSLKGSPIKVGGRFICLGNLLDDLVGGPKSVGDDYNCTYNKITKLTGFPNYFHSVAYFQGNPAYEILDKVYHSDRNTFIKWLIEFDVIREGNKIVEMRLEEAYYMTYKEEMPLEERTFEHYTLI